MKRQFTLKTNLLVMSRVSELLEKLDIALLPDENEDFELFAQMVLLELSKNEADANKFFQEITGESINFTEEIEYSDLVEVLSNFFEQLGQSFKKLLVMKKKESLKRNDFAMNQMMEKITDKMSTMILEKEAGLKNI